MKAWNQRSQFLLFTSIEQNKSDFEVYFDSVRMLARTSDLEQLQQVLEMYNPNEENLRIKVFSGESNRSTEHIFSAQSAQNQTGGTSEFDLKLQLIQEQGRRERMEDKLNAEIERLREKLKLAEAFIEKQKETLDNLRKKGSGAQTGQIISLAQKFLQRNAPPQVGGSSPSGASATRQSSPENEHLAPWISSLQGVDQLEAGEQNQLRECIEMAMLDPDLIWQWSQVESQSAEIDRLTQRLEKSEEFIELQKETIASLNQTASAHQTGQIATDIAPDPDMDLAPWIDCLRGVDQISEAEQDELQQLIVSVLEDPSNIHTLNQMING